MFRIYNINYHSVNEYEQPVTNGIFEYLITPCNDDSQTLLDFTLKKSCGEEVFFSKNSYGFQTIRIRVKEPIKQFTFSYSAKIQKQESVHAIDDERTLSEQLAQLDSRDFFIDNHLFFSKSILTSIAPENKTLVFNYNRKTGILTFLDQLNAHIHKLLTYEVDQTDIKTTANDVLQLKKGVCQDFAHLFIAMAKENGFAARYVAGYLDQGVTFIGAAMMHAWAEVYVPGQSWVGFDPTNNLRVNTHYIKVCHGTDYHDCSPIKGILHTRGDNKTTHHVEVAQQQQ